ncbi:hypothetical protein BG004_003142 [Podila humilis]|nr:hypothetical protein BG004_003142 [Podila humilis]
MDTEATHGNRNDAGTPPSLVMPVGMDIIDGQVIDDGSVTPRAVVATGTSVFEQGLITGTTVPDGAARTMVPYVSSEVQRLEVISVDLQSPSTPRSSSPSPATTGQQQQQQQQQQQPAQMSEEPYSPDLVEFLERENIRRIHYKIEGNKEPFIEIDEQVISSALTLETIHYLYTVPKESIV